MFGIEFYEDKNGRSPVYELMKELESRNDKNSRINLTKIQDYLRTLRSEGTFAGEPYIKHLEAEIWEIRPIRNRILFASWNGSNFILLHHFIKTTQKTPQKEIDKAKRNLADITERSKQDE